LKIVVIIAVVAVALWFANHYYRPDTLGFLLEPDIGASIGQKCITKEGNVIYGQVPNGIQCERTEAVNGSITIVPGSKPSAGKLSSSSYQDSQETSGFKCDGRTYCSQMRSCEEALFFLRNCPDVKMDGDNDGVPCEKQWCG
jgi:hypothetical protein